MGYCYGKSHATNTLQETVVSNLTTNMHYTAMQ